MAIAFLLLGLFPLMFFGDMLSGGGADADTADDEDMADDTSGNVDIGTGDFLDQVTDTVDSGVQTGVQTGVTGGDEGPVLQPVTDDEVPVEGEEVDPGSVLAPVTDDEIPEEGDEVDPGSVLSPNEDEFPVEGDGTFLQQLLLSETDALAGVGYLDTQIDSTTDTDLGAGDDIHDEADDGIAGTGEGALSGWHGTPILRTDGTLSVISGGEGDDTITAGDGAAYVFGGEGDDTLAAGEGVSALFGGAGADTLTGTDTGAIAYLDGGDGNDVLLGGDAAEALEGGAHGEGDADVQDDDYIDGGAGDDAIRGGYGADTLLGGDGDDLIDHLGRAEERMLLDRTEFAWHIDNDADTLDGGAGNDTLIMDRADTATGGEGADTFWVYHDELSGSGAAVVTDFQVGEDFLRVTLNPEAGLGDPELSVAPSDDGLDGLVTVNGEVVAILQGAPNASVHDVYAEVVADVFV